MENGFPYGPTEPTEVLLDRLIQGDRAAHPPRVLRGCCWPRWKEPYRRPTESALPSERPPSMGPSWQFVKVYGAARYLASSILRAVASGAIVADRVIVDVHHTAMTDFATGIQRVTREASRRWGTDHRPVVVGWTPNHESLRVDPGGTVAPTGAGLRSTVPTDDPVVVPWRCTYLLPELAAEPDRTDRLQALARYSGSSLGIIGYDLVPVTTAETCHEGLIPASPAIWPPSATPATMVPISESAAGEYRGWRAMLAGTGLSGPGYQHRRAAGRGSP